MIKRYIFARHSHHKDNVLTGEGLQLAAAQGDFLERINSNGPSDLLIHSSEPRTKKTGLFLIGQIPNSCKMIEVPALAFLEKDPYMNTLESAFAELGNASLEEYDALSDEVKSTLRAHAERAYRNCVDALFYSNVKPGGPDNVFVVGHGVFIPALVRHVLEKWEGPVDYVKKVTLQEAECFELIFNSNTLLTLRTHRQP